MQLFVIQLSGKTIALDACSSDTILALKQKLHDKTFFLIDQHNLSCDGKILSEELHQRTLSDLKITPSSKLRIEVRLRSGAASDSEGSVRSEGSSAASASEWSGASRSPSPSPSRPRRRSRSGSRSAGNTPSPSRKPRQLRTSREKKETAAPRSSEEKKDTAAPKTWSKAKKHKDRVKCLRGGPILFTAPHGISVKRPGCRDHAPERWTTELAVQIARDIGYEHCSYIIWNKRTTSRHKPAEPDDMDPNYLEFKDFEKSPWNQFLRDHAKNRTCNLKEGGEVKDDLRRVLPPGFNLDLHGKSNPKKKDRPLVVDVGIQPMRSLWKSKRDQKFIECLRKAARKELRKAFQGTEFKVNTNPRLHGYWGCDIHTISEQACRLNMAAIQFEFPYDFRKALSLNPDLRKKFSQAIYAVYNDVVVPYGVPDAYAVKRTK